MNRKDGFITAALLGTMVFFLVLGSISLRIWLLSAERYRTAREAERSKQSIREEIESLVTADTPGAELSPLVLRSKGGTQAFPEELLLLSKRHPLTNQRLPSWKQLRAIRKLDCRGTSESESEKLSSLSCTLVPTAIAASAFFAGNLSVPKLLIQGSKTEKNLILAAAGNVEVTELTLNGTESGVVTLIALGNISITTLRPTPSVSLVLASILGKIRIETATSPLDWCEGTGAVAGPRIHTEARLGTYIGSQRKAVNLAGCGIEYPAPLWPPTQLISPAFSSRDPGSG